MKDKKRKQGPSNSNLHQTNPRSKEISSAGSVPPASSGSAFENFLFLPGFDLRTIAPFQVATHIILPKKALFLNASCFDLYEDLVFTLLESFGRKTSETSKEQTIKCKHISCSLYMFSSLSKKHSTTSHATIYVRS